MELNMTEDIDVRNNVPQKAIGKLIDNKLKKISIDHINPNTKILTIEIFCTQN